MAASAAQTNPQRVAAARLTQNDAKRELAAILLANDEMRPIHQPKRSDQVIAEEIGVSRATITRWKRDPEFDAMKQDARGKIIADALRLPIAQKHDRIRRLNDLYESYWEIRRLRGETYAQSADSPEEAARRVFGTNTPPWAATGMMLAQPKISANGTIVTEWAFDKALDSAIKEAMKQAAQETGQWEETINHNHTINEYQDARLASLSVADLEAIDSILAGED
jgi:hypothetical protein